MQRATADAPSSRGLPVRVDFHDTRRAFAHLSDGALRKAVWLFRVMGNPSLVGLGAGMANLGFALRLPIGGLVRGTIYKQFVGGETIEQCEGTIKQLWGRHVGTILDYSVEGASTDKEFDETRDEILRTIARAMETPQAIPFCVFKVTGVVPFGVLEKVSAGQVLSPAEEAAWHKGRARVEKIAAAAGVTRTRLFFDAEESWIQDAIDLLAENAMLVHNSKEPIIYNTVQLYRHDRLHYLKALTGRNVKAGIQTGVKLVRGAYMEKERKRAAGLGLPSPIQLDKAASDRDYDGALAWCIQHIDRFGVCVGTHNEKSTRHMMDLMEQAGVSPSDERIYFSQLLGMSDNLSFNLADAGYRVAKYVPYGPVKSTLPYLTRRAQENTSIAGQTSRELQFLVGELERRKREGR